MGRERRVSALVVLAVLMAGGLVAFVVRAPRNDREWAVDHARLPTVTLNDDQVRIQNVRDFRHRTSAEPETRYRDESFPLAGVRRVWFALAPFANRYRGLAHSFLSFEFEDGRVIAVSVEARREVDEGYSLVGGLMRAFEITYVVGTERDLIGLRALRGDTLFLYPSKATPEQARALFADMMARARDLQVSPEFYNTLFNNCNTNLRDHVNRTTPADLPWGWGILLPGFSDALALEHGLLDTELDVAEARRRFRVDELARDALAGDPEEFSRRIRGSG